MTEPLRYLNEAELSALLGVSRPTLYRWRRQKVGPVATRLGPKRIGYSSANVSAWLAAQERAPIAA